MTYEELKVFAEHHEIKTFPDGGNKFAPCHKLMCNECVFKGRALIICNFEESVLLKLKKNHPELFI